VRQASLACYAGRRVIRRAAPPRSPRPRTAAANRAAPAGLLESALRPVPVFAGAGAATAGAVRTTNADSEKFATSNVAEVGVVATCAAGFHFYVASS